MVNSFFMSRNINFNKEPKTERKLEYHILRESIRKNSAVAVTKYQLQTMQLESYLNTKGLIRSKTPIEKRSS